MAELLASLQAALADRYAIERELGHGGMATVYLAQDLKHHRQVAIKLLRPELAATLGAERFLREIEIAARLTHPHILPLHDSGEADGFLYYVMPYVPGESLRGRLTRERQLSLDDALQITREVADALSHAHALGIVHRDIKPENILFEAGHAVVSDFGIARAISAAGGETLTETGIAVGTPAYMSPEQASAESQIDARSDIYSLGCVLYEMLAGEPPHTGPSAQAVLAKRFTGAIPHVRTVRGGVPESIDHALSKALATAPADRYASAAKFADALRQASEGRSPAQRFGVGSFLRQRPLFAVFIVGVLVGVGVLFGWRHTRSGAEDAGPKRLAVLPFENLGRPEDDYFADGVSDAVRGKLTELPGLAVIARTSSMQYRKTAKSPQSIAQELGVRYLLMGTVRWAKGPTGSSRVEVSPELIEVMPAGAPESRWQEPFDAAVQDVFQVQGDIAGNVAKALQLALGSGVLQALEARPTDNLAAYDAYLKGEAAMPVLTFPDPRSLQRAGDFYLQAVGLDSGFALGWARLAQVSAIAYANGYPTPARAEATRRAMEHAVKLAPGAPETQIAVFLYQSNVRDNAAAARQAVEAGLARAPNNTELLVAVANLDYDVSGRWEQALARLTLARALDPRSVDVAIQISRVLLWLRRWGEARAEAIRGLAIAPPNLNLIRYEALSYLGEGNLAAAQAVIREVPAGVDQVALVVHLAQDELEWLLDDAQQRLLVSLPLSAFGDDRVQWNKARAETYRWRGDQARVQVYADSARRAAEAELGKPLPAWLRASNESYLGLDLALLGQRDAAIQAGEAAVALLPVDSNVTMGYFCEEMLVRTYVLTGEDDKALDELETLVRNPYLHSPGWLRIDPNYAPLRGNPRFQRLLAQR